MECTRPCGANQAAQIAEILQIAGATETGSGTGLLAERSMVLDAMTGIPNR